MKSLRNTTLIWAMIFIADISYSQCSESNVGNSTTDNTIQIITQSITADCDGNLSQFAIYHAPSSNTITSVMVYEGEGCGGTEIYNSSDPIPGTQSTTFINFDPVIPVTNGQQYTINIVTDGGFLTLLDGMNRYPGGDRYSNNCGLKLQEDIIFSYTIDVSAPIPTLSQWMIIILGLILTITGMAVMLQKKNLNIIRN